jgi:hypothetical protein
MQLRAGGVRAIMHRRSNFILSIPLLLSALAASGCGGWIRSRSSTANTPPALPPNASLADDERAFAETVRFLEARVKDDPADFVAYNLLHGHYLRKAQPSRSGVRGRAGRPLQTGRAGARGGGAVRARRADRAAR